MTDDAIIRAPFNPATVVALNKFQRLGFVHPFTCKNHGDSAHRPTEDDALIATVRGWICPFCDYTQDWAHALMCSPDWFERHQQMLDEMFKVRSLPTSMQFTDDVELSEKAVANLKRLLR